MMTQDSKKYELLGEISKLLKKYGKETFSELATILKDQNFCDDIAEALINISQLSPKKKVTQKRPTLLEESLQLRESFLSIGKTEPERSKILLLLLDSLQNKIILPSLRELTNFISDQGVPMPKGKSRDKLVLSFLRNCAELKQNDLEELNAIINRQQPSIDADRSLEGWGKVILDRKKRD